MTRRWLDQVEALAREALPEPVFRYVAEGARDEISVGEAVAAWQSVRVAPRILRDVRHVETSTDLLGTTYDLPLGIAPMTLQRAADPDGEVAMARAAAAAGVPMVVSSNSGSTFSDIASDRSLLVAADLPAGPSARTPCPCCTRPWLPVPPPSY